MLRECTPFKFEGQERRKNAELGLEMLRHTSSSLVVVPNDNFLFELKDDQPILQLFELIDSHIVSVIKNYGLLCYPYWYKKNYGNNSCLHLLNREAIKVNQYAYEQLSKNILQLAEKGKIKISDIDQQMLLCEALGKPGSIY